MREGWRELRKGLYRRDADAAVVRQDGRGWFARDERGFYLMPAGHEPAATITESDDAKRRFRSADDAMAALDGEDVEDAAPVPRGPMSVSHRDHIRLSQWAGQIRKQKWNLEGELASGRHVLATADKPARFEAAKAMAFEGVVDVVRQGPRRVTKGPPGADGRRRLREEIVIVRRVRRVTDDESLI